MAELIQKITNCCMCHHHAKHDIITADSFEHESGIYCTKYKDSTDDWAKHTYHGFFPYRVVCTDEWDPSKYAKVPNWCPLISERLNTIIAELGKLIPTDSENIFKKYFNGSFSALSFLQTQLPNLKLYRLKGDVRAPLFVAIALELECIDNPTNKDVKKVFEDNILSQEDLDTIHRITRNGSTTTAEPNSLDLSDISYVDAVYMLTHYLCMFTFRRSSIHMLPPLLKFETKYDKHYRPKTIARLYINAKRGSKHDLVAKHTQPFATIVRRICQEHLMIDEFRLFYNNRSYSWQKFFSNTCQ